MLDFERLLKREAVERFRDAFIADTGMSLSFSDIDHHEYSTFYAHSKCEFCRLVNSNEEGLKKCKKSARLAGKKAAKSGQPLVYQCWAGLAEIVVPVIVDGKHIANVYTGQVLTQDAVDSSVQTAMRRMSFLGLSEQEIKAAYYAIKVIPQWRLVIIKSMLQMMVEYMVQSELNDLLKQKMISEENRVRAAHDFVTAEIVNAIVRNKRDVLRESWQHLAFLGFSQVPDTLMLVKRDASDTISEPYNLDYNMNVREKVLSILKSAIQSDCECLVWPLDMNTYLLIVSLGCSKDLDKQFQKSTSLAWDLLKRAKEETGESFRISIADPKKRVEWLGISYQEAVEALKSTEGRHGAERVVHTQQAAVTDTLMLGRFPDLLPLSGFDECKSMEHLSMRVEEIMSMLESNREISLPFVKAVCIEVMHDIFRFLKGRGILILEENWPLIWIANIVDSTSIEETKEVVNTCLEAVKSSLTVSKKGDFEQSVMTAISYISEHFRDNITLKMLAEKAYVTPNYLSHLFKKHTGMRCVEYINRLRLDFVKRRLAGTNLSVAAIAEEAGFRSSSYLNILFKKVEKLTPMQYRSTANAGISIREAKQ